MTPVEQVRSLVSEGRLQMRIVAGDRRPCWTLVIVLRSVREWGFWHRGVFMHWRNYVSAGNPIADSRKACR